MYLLHPLYQVLIRHDLLTWDSIRKRNSASNTSRKGTLFTSKYRRWSSPSLRLYFEKLLGPQLGWEPLGNPREQAATQIVTVKHFCFTMRKNMHQLFSWHRLLWRQGCAKMEELLKCANDIRERNVKVRFLGRWGIKTEYKLDSRGCWLGVILFFSSFKSIVKILVCLFKSRKMGS